MITTFAGNGTQGFAGDGGAAASAHLNHPRGVAVDANGNVYIADANNDRVRKVSTSGIITTVAGNGTAGYSGDGGPATAAMLNKPVSVAADYSGNVYIADANNNRIRKLKANGTIITFAGTGYPGADDGLPATNARLNLPTGVATDSKGNVYIADSYSNRIRKVDTGGIIHTIAGDGVAGFGGDGTAATSAEINMPSSVAADAVGNVYFADQNNYRIRKIIASTGIIMTIAGSGTMGYSGDDSMAINAKLNLVTGVAVDASGNVYIADRLNSRVRKVNTSGIISTIAGDGGFAYFGDGGPAIDAGIGAPFGVVVDAHGNVYIADADDYRVRKIQGSATGVGSSPVTGNSSARIYPSPAHDYITIAGTGRSATAILTDMQGRALMNNIAAGSGALVSIGHLASGLYILRLSDGQSFKLVKE